MWFLQRSAIMDEKYLDQLNPAQREAVVTVEGPMLVIAGAGSGKTRVLTYRVAHCLKVGIQPHNILALTFTNKAAQEMKSRIGTVVGDVAAQKLWMGTFHSIFGKILRFEAKAINFSSNFTIYDTQDTKSLIKSIVRELKLDEKIYTAGECYSKISAAKNALILPPQYEADATLRERDAIAKRPSLFKVYATYMRRCSQSDVMDFDDLLLYSNILFKNHPEILAKYQEKFRFVLVDEYQDTNHSQYLLIKQLCATHHNLCVVGDDAQSIYSFRGANIGNILNFRNDYPNYKTVKLEQNYRSTQNIVNAANSIIKKNAHQIKKESFSEKVEGNKIQIIKGFSDQEEGVLIARGVLERNRAGTDFQDIAILYRTNAQSRVFEEAFRKLQIPYKIYGGLSFYQRKEIKDIIAYFRLVVNPLDDESFKRIINYPARGIGKTTLEAIENQAAEGGKSMWNSAVGLNTSIVSAGTVKKVSSFLQLIMTFRQSMENMNAYDLANEIATQSGYIKELYLDKTPENMARQENFEELLNAIKEYCNTQEEKNEPATLIDFLQGVALLTDADTEKADEKNKVTLMTIHAAKGLEFRSVFIVGVEESTFPSSMTVNEPAGLEEERRLFYVALTRAEEFVALSYVKQRMKWGQITFPAPSRFLTEIDSQYLDGDIRESRITSGNATRNEGFGSNKFGGGFNSSSGQGTTRKFGSFSNPEPTTSRFAGSLGSGSSSFKKVPPVSQSTSSPLGSPSTNLKEGMVVEHFKFGKGLITSIEEAGIDTRGIINFDNFGEKQLLLKFAKLKIIE